ncbi:MAG: hypothetical protein K2Q09_07535, partial [Phycisphaerales bacterium]|nr:hypothetical protein [Phycisphaerales bacterium]
MDSTLFQPGLMVLRRLRRVMRAGLVAQRALWLLAVAVAVSVGLGLLDFALRLPAAVRGGILALVLSLLVISIWRRVLLSLRFRPPLEELALRLESLGEPAPQAAGVLASGVDFARRLAADGNTPPTFASALSRRVVESASTFVPAIRIWRVLRWKPVAFACAAAAACVIGMVSLRAATPELFQIGARRVLLPWSDASWPKRSRVLDLTGLDVHPLGSALSLRAWFHERGSAGPSSSGRVVALYRLVGPDGTVGPERRLVLTSQARTVSAPVGQGEPAALQGTLHERIVDAAALEYAAEMPAATATRFEYTLQTTDDATPWRSVALVRPPAVIGATASVSPPAYAARSPDFAPRTTNLGTGSDQRATLSGVLAGSRVELTITLNKPVPVPGDGPGAPTLRDWLSASLGE